jgi:putative ABC transport system permease protein
MFSSVAARTQEFGVLKALGFRTRALAGTVMVETAVVIAFAVPLGILIAFILAVLIHWAAPLYLVLPLEPVPVLRTIVASALLAMLGALMPIRAIARIEPAQVFRT